MQSAVAGFRDAAAVFGESLMKLGIRNIALSHGEFYLHIFGATTGQLDFIKADQRVGSVGFTSIVGDGYIDEGRSMFVHAPDEDWVDGTHIEYRAGRLPQRSGCRR